MVALLGCTGVVPPTAVAAATEAAAVAGPEPTPAPVLAPLTREERIVARAREEVVRGTRYDAAYFRLSYKDGVDTGKAVYPGGDLDPERGVCTDVVIRGLRAVGVDLQERVHTDIVAHRSAYPHIDAVDFNIDHRRVGPLLTYFGGHARALPKETTGAARETWKAADIVIWAFRECPRCSPDHIGLVSDRLGPRGLPLVVHNISPRPTEDDVLDAWTILGHFRVTE